MIRVAFRADGSEEIGLGHLMRCYAIASVFQKQGDEVLFYCSHGTSGIQWLKGKNIIVEEMPIMSSLQEEADFLSDRVRTSKTDILILDSYFLSDEYIEYVGASDVFLACIDDGHRYSYVCDAVINCNLTALSIDYSDCKVSTFFLGGKYNILREEFVNTPPAEFREKVQNIMVTMGGSDPNKYVYTALEGLKNIEDITIHVVIGPLWSGIEKLKTIAEKCRSEVQLYVNPPSMAEIMHVCDLAISAGGGTIRELFSMGVVPLVVLQAENQNPLKRYLADNDLPLCLGSFYDVTADMIEDKTEQLIRDTSLRYRCREKINSLLQRNGAEELVNEIKVFVSKE